MRVCANCGEEYVVAESNATDFVHQCNSGPARDKEDVLETTTPNWNFQGNFGYKRGVKSFTGNGNPADRYREREHEEYLG